MTTYWPGTKIVKSKNNAFDWQGKNDSVITRDRDWQLSAIGARNAGRQGDSTKSTSFTIYSKAVASKKKPWPQ